MSGFVLLPSYYKKYLWHGHIKNLIQGHVVFQWENTAIDVFSSYKVFNNLGLTFMWGVFSKEAQEKTLLCRGENTSRGTFLVDWLAFWGFLFGFGFVFGVVFGFGLFFQFRHFYIFAVKILSSCDMKRVEWNFLSVRKVCISNAFRSWLFWIRFSFAKKAYKNIFPCAAFMDENEPRCCFCFELIALSLQYAQNLNSGNWGFLVQV